MTSDEPAQTPEPEWEPPPDADARWHQPPNDAWASDNPEATLAILRLCEERPFLSSMVDEEARRVFRERKALDVPVGSVVVVLPDDARVYVVAPDGADEVEPVRYLGQWVGDPSTLAGGEPEDSTSPKSTS